VEVGLVFCCFDIERYEESCGLMTKGKSLKVGDII
jgi:hypothetical protein